MNKYYWINIPDSPIFYIIPEDELLKNNKLSTKERIINNPILSINLNSEKSWYQKYKHYYDKLNREDIINLFI